MVKARLEPMGDDYTKDVYFLYEVFRKLGEDKKATVHFLRDFFTKSELRMFRRRWYIACLLDKGHDIRLVANLVKAGVDTVGRVKRKIKEGTGGLRKALEKTRKGRREELANIFTKDRSLRVVKSWRKPPKPEVITRWVFGSGGPPE